MTTKKNRTQKVTVPTTPVDPAEALKSKLINGGCQKAIEPLEAADMLDVELLTESTIESLMRYVTEGMARKIKKLFPSETTHVSEGEEIPDDEKPTVHSAQSNPQVANRLGLDPMMLVHMLAGGGNMQAAFGLVNIETLLSWYDPEDPDNLATNLLQQRFGTEPLIAFIPGTREVAIKDSTEYIKDRRRGYDKQENIHVDGKLARLYPVGVLPLDFVEEDPLVIVDSGKKAAMLRRGRSSKYNADFNGISLSTRQLVRIIVERRDANPGVRSDLKLLMKTAAEGFEALAEEYPEAYLSYQEREAAGKLPSLRAELGTQVSDTADNQQTQKPAVQSTPPAQQYSSGGGIPWRDRA